MTHATRALGASLRMMVVATVALGLLYPAAGLLIGRAMPHQADGSLIEVDGVVVGSTLLGQPVDGDEWFHGRPSAVDHDAMASGGSNAGPSNLDLVADIEARRAEVADREGVDPSIVPTDAVTASGSGLDPHISPAYARLQVERVATARSLDVAEVERLVREATAAEPALALGDATVNVVALNTSLAALG